MSSVANAEPHGTNIWTRCSSKVLIANRGEIAVRVIRACRELGIASVAVYSDLDRDALHVRLADEAYALGGQTAAESYLNTEAILDVIERSGADGGAPRLRLLLREHRLRPGHHREGRGVHRPAARGDRGDGRQGLEPRIAAAARPAWPACPGTTEFLTDADEVVAFGDEHGWPVAIKAAYGGGGRGMKVVRGGGRRRGRASSRRQREALKGTSAAARCYVERYLTWPRHVEMQIIGDTHGNCVWVGERDCSAQRRHQKLIEESPAPAFPDDVRAGDGRGRGQGRQGVRLLRTPAPSSSSTRTATSSSSR